MPSGKFSGKSKADLVLLATLGNVLSQEVAKAMTKAKLADYLQREEDKALGLSGMRYQDEERKPVKRKRAGRKKSEEEKAEEKDTGEEKSGLDDGSKDSAQEKPEVKDSDAKRDLANEKKLSKKELNKLKFLEEMAEKEKKSASASKSANNEQTKEELQEKKSETSESADDAEPLKRPAKRGRKPKKKIEDKEPEINKEKSSEDKNAASKDEKKATSKDENIKSKKPIEDIPTDKLREKISQRVVVPSKKSSESKDGKKEILPIIPSKTEGLTASVGDLPEKIREHLKQTETASGSETVSGKESTVSGKRTGTPPSVELTEIVEGILEVMSDGYGFLRKDNYLQSSKDIYVPPQYIRRFNLRTGDKIVGPGKLQKENDRYQAILYIKEVNGRPPEEVVRRPKFERLTPIYPDERFVLETTRNELSTRIIDLIAPIGKGQRGMIVSPPKAGKTILLQKIANAIATNNPKSKLIVLLIDERPEEVTDMQRSIKGEVVYSTFDKTPENHVKIVELVLERAMRLVELGEDVVILLDSITRLGRAYNLTINPTGRTLSGGLDPGALYGPKRFFGAARNIEGGGSLTIIATALIDTGSRMDEVIFEEFKGTGNMEVYLDRKLSEKRIFPAIDINRSGTRREEILLNKQELDAVWTIRKAFGQLDTAAVTEMIINLLLKTSNNGHFVSSVNVSLNDKAVFDAMRGNKPSQNNNGSGNNNY